MTMTAKYDMPMHEVDEEERYISDFYDYLDRPENETRYTPTLDWLNRQYGNKRFSLLDVGCGHAQLKRIAPATCDYVGIDHSDNAIDKCRSLYPSDEFHCVDVLDTIGAWGNNKLGFDAIVFAGMINHMVDKESLKTKSDWQVIGNCVQRLSKPGGYVSIIVGVPYRTDVEFGFYSQAAWKNGKIDEAVRDLPFELVAQTLTAQVGLEKQIRKQKQKPDWFIESPQDVTSNRHTGEFIGSLTCLFKVDAPGNSKTR